MGRHCRKNVTDGHQKQFGKTWQRMVGMLYRKYTLVIDGRIRVCIDGKTGTT